MRSRRGFTLTEIIIAISIAAVIAAIGIPQLVRMNRNTELGSIANQVKSDLGEAGAKARTSNSTIVLPTGYNPNSPTSSSFSGVIFDEVRVMLSGQQIGGHKFNPVTANGKIAGPDTTQTTLTDAVQVVLCNQGAVVRTLQAYDSSGSAVWDVYLDMSNGYQTQEIHCLHNTTNMTLTLRDSANATPP